MPGEKNAEVKSLRHYACITIDTEEDLWGGYTVKRPPVENMKKIPLLQEIFEKHNAVPTYLINYPVATDPYSVDLLSGLLQRKKCDIGTHCHPWNTPPFYHEGESERNSFMCNLPEELILSKLTSLHNAIQENFHFTPTVFRAGRWGVGEGVIRTIQRLGYKIDTSVTPYLSWEESHGPKMYLSANTPVGLKGMEVTCDKPTKCNACGNNDCIVEIPPTIGFLQKNFTWCHRLRSFLMNSAWKRFHLIGILERLRLLNFRMLSPETSSLDDMIKLSRAMMRNGHRFLNMTFHSTSLLAGSSPFVNNEDELKLFLNKIDGFLEFLAKEKVTSIGMSGAMEVLA